MLEIYYLVVSSLWALVLTLAPGIPPSVCADGATPCPADSLEFDGGSMVVEPIPPPAVPPTDQAPVILGAPASVAWTGQPYTFQPAAIDPDGDALVFQISHAPSWASFDTLTGRLSGNPTSDFIGISDGITIAVSDGANVRELPPFSIEVRAQANGSAVLIWVAPTRNTDASTLTDLAGFMVRYGTSPDALDLEVRIASPVIASCVLVELTPGEWYFEVIAYNVDGIESEPSSRAYKFIS